MSLAHNDIFFLLTKSRLFSYLYIIFITMIVMNMYYTSR